MYRMLFNRSYAVQLLDSSSLFKKCTGGTENNKKWQDMEVVFLGNILYSHFFTVRTLIVYVEILVCFYAELEIGRCMRGVACCNNVSSRHCVRTSPGFRRRYLIAFSFLHLVNQMWRLLPGSYMHLAAFVLLSFAFSLPLQHSPSLPVSCLSYEGGLVCIEANPLMLNVSHQPLRPHRFHRCLCVCAFIVCVWWYLCGAGSDTNRACLFYASVL